MARCGAAAGGYTMLVDMPTTSVPARAWRRALASKWMIGNSTPSILGRYSKAIDEHRRDAVRKLEDMRAEQAN